MYANINMDNIINPLETGDIFVYDWKKDITMHVVQTSHQDLAIMHTNIDNPFQASIFYVNVHTVIYSWPTV